MVIVINMMVEGGRETWLEGQRDMVVFLWVADTNQILD